MYPNAHVSPSSASPHCLTVKTNNVSKLLVLRTMTTAVRADDDDDDRDAAAAVDDDKNVPTEGGSGCNTSYTPYWMMMMMRPRALSLSLCL